MKITFALSIVHNSITVICARTGRKAEDADSGGRDRFSRDVSLNKYINSIINSDDNDEPYPIEQVDIQTPGVSAIFKKLNLNQLNRPRLIMTPHLLVIGSGVNRRGMITTSNGLNVAISS